MCGPGLGGALAGDTSPTAGRPKHRLSASPAAPGGRAEGQGLPGHLVRVRVLAAQRPRTGIFRLKARPSYPGESMKPEKPHPLAPEPGGCRSFSTEPGAAAASKTPAGRRRGLRGTSGGPRHPQAPSSTSSRQSLLGVCVWHAGGHSHDSPLESGI